MDEHPVIIVVPRWALPEQERLQVLTDDDDQPHAVLIREGTTIGHDLAKLINDIVHQLIAVASLKRDLCSDAPSRNWYASMYAWRRAPFPRLAEDDKEERGDLPATPL